MIMIAVSLPESELILRDELQTTQPFGAFPKIEFGDQHAHGVAMILVKRSTVELVS